MFVKYLLGMIFLVSLTSAAVAQVPPRQPGMPRPGGPPHDQRPGPGGEPDDDWIKPLDSNQNSILERDEFEAAVMRTFGELDRNSNGSIDAGEGRFRADGGPPMGPGPGGPRGPRPDGKRLLPPFFFMRRVDENGSLTKAEFENAVRDVFSEMDKNGDGSIGKNEMRPPRRDGGPKGPGGPPNARFIAAELRFGDKLIAGQPFSADVLIEDTRRLFDGSTVTKQRKGAIYRDGAGRTRREQELENVAGFNIVGTDDKPQRLVFINDFVAKTQTFLDLNNKVARTNRLANNPKPFERDEPEGAKTVSLGTKTIEGVKVDGTRTTFEIPVGQLGNDKPIEVVTEKWFSPELGVVIMSRHLDPLAGEHVFKLVNLKRGEPSAELFAVPAGFRVENPGPKKEER